jgi:hypothetical protein
MRVMFIENRYATRIYEAVARQLQLDGHEIHWIIQNPVFKVSAGQSHVLLFPAADIGSVLHSEEELFRRIAATDRQVRYFGSKPTHYSHYFLRIQAIVDLVRPDVVFGESTQFYELLALEICRRRAIQYLNPVTVGCPPGRFYFLAYDTKDPAAGSQAGLTREVAISLIDRINQRQSVPAYMSTARLSPARRWLTRVRDRFLITSGWVRGERFATPSPIRKLRRDLAQRRIRRKWEDLASAYAGAKDPYVLYALHVQPECSIDVWGFAWRDQAELIRRAAAALATDGLILAIKPHPNSKYEVTDRLCEIVSQSSNIRPISAGVSMRDIFSSATAILGVTGTVLLEAVFAGIPAISVGPNAMSKYPGIIEISTPEDVVVAVHQARESSKSSELSAIELLRWLYRTSYQGEMFEPLFAADRLQSEHMRELHAAFSDVLTHLFDARAAMSLPVASSGT